MGLFQKWIAAVSFGLMALSAGASPSNPQNGAEYLTLNKSQPTDSGDKVEVLEFFSYACPHCNALDPSLSEWVKKQGDKIVFKRVPISFNRPTWGMLQKLYYTLESIGRLDLHPKVFRAYHEERTPLDSDDKIADFVAKQGVDKAKFMSAYNSFGVQTKVARATQLMETYNIDSVPTLIINGRYVTSPAMAGAGLGNLPESKLHVAMLEVLDWLVKKAAPAAKPAEAKPAAAEAKKDAKEKKEKPKK